MNKIIFLIKKPGYVLKCLFSYIRYGFKAGEFHYNNYIEKALCLKGIENIYIGRGSFIRKNAHIEVIPYTGERQCKFKIGEYSHFQFGAHIIATKSVEIGNYCNIGTSVYIADNTHTYENINIPIKLSPIKQLSPVSIGDGTWIGTRAVIIGCSVGKHCVIGANSVVKHNIPDYSIAVGMPAKIIKRYDFTTQSWRKTNPQGEFLD